MAFRRLFLTSCTGRIAYAAHGGIAAFEVFGVNVDDHAEIGVALADGVAEVPEMAVAVLAGVDGDDAGAAPPHQFVDPEILEMAAVGQIDEG